MGRLRVLLVDDSDAIRRAAHRQLGSEFDLVSVPDGKAALRFLACNQIDAVVADFRLPGVSGVDLLRVVERTYPSLARILWSGGIDPRIESPTTGGRAYVFLRKPSSTQEIVSSVVSALASAARPAQEERAAC